MLGYSDPFPTDRYVVINLYGPVRTFEDAAALRSVVGAQKFSFPVEYEIQVDAELVRKYENKQHGFAGDVPTHR
jgi:hypothetical protein